MNLEKESKGPVRTEGKINNNKMYLGLKEAIIESTVTVQQINRPSF